MNLITCKGCIHEEICPNTNAYEDMLNVKDYCKYFVDKSALEKQIPKKPIERFINTYSDDMAISCPCCKQPIVNVWNKKDYKPLYCHYCGQALDWSDTE